MMCARCFRVLKTRGYMFNGEDDILYCHHCSRQESYERMKNDLGRLVVVKLRDREKRSFCSTKCKECGRFIGNKECLVHGA